MHQNANIVYYLEHEPAKRIYDLNIYQHFDQLNIKIINLDKKYEKIHTHIMAFMNVIYSSLLNSNIIIFKFLFLDL